jgi:hypothetical protein
MSSQQPKPDVEDQLEVETSKTAPEAQRRGLADPEDIRRRTGKWQIVLYAINGFTAGMGIVLMGVAGWAKNSPQSIALPAFALNILIAFGLIVMLISFLGLYGAWRAPDKIDNRATNWFLWAYFLIIFIAIILQLVAAGVLLTLVGTINSAANNQVETVDNSFENSLRTLISENLPQWAQLQDYFGCCGYNCSNTWRGICPFDYPTGSLCVPPGVNMTCPPCYNPTPSSVSTCRELLLSKASQEATALGAIAIVFVFLELLAFTATFCLLCCVKVDYEIE